MTPVLARRELFDSPTPPRGGPTLPLPLSRARVCFRSASIFRIPPLVRDDLHHFVNRPFSQLSVHASLGALLTALTRFHPYEPQDELLFCLHVRPDFPG